MYDPRDFVLARLHSGSVRKSGRVRPTGEQTSLGGIDLVCLRTPAPSLTLAGKSSTQETVSLLNGTLLISTSLFGSFYVLFTEIRNAELAPIRCTGSPARSRYVISDSETISSLRRLPIFYFVLSWLLISYTLPNNNNVITSAPTHKLGCPT